MTSDVARWQKKWHNTGFVKSNENVCTVKSTDFTTAPNG